MGDDVRRRVPKYVIALIGTAFSIMTVGVLEVIERAFYVAHFQWATEMYVGALPGMALIFAPVLLLLTAFFGQRYLLRGVR